MTSLRARRRPGRPSTPGVAHAYAPGHVTGLFAPDLTAPDPRARGSVGAGLVLSMGATAVASDRPGPRRVTVRDDEGRWLPISEEVARRLWTPADGTLTVTVHHDLPVGQGFGMSAAGAVATALAVARLAGVDRRRAVEVAHLADLFGGGGLGGVAAILGGGWERRTRAGVPPWGTVVHAPFPRSVFVGVVGPPLPSPSLLRRLEFLHRVSTAAKAGLGRLGRAPTPDHLLRESERFTDRLGLASRHLRDVVHELRRTRARVAQAMFGESFWAVANDPAGREALIRALERLGVPAVELPTAATGPRVGRGAPPPSRESVLNRARLARLP